MAPVGIDYAEGKASLMPFRAMRRKIKKSYKNIHLK
jgi:hypothetical protein